jgi:hypothetical protein
MSSDGPAACDRRTRGAAAELIRRPPTIDQHALTRHIRRRIRGQKLGLMPALFTSTSIRPCRAITASRNAITSASFATRYMDARPRTNRVGGMAKRLRGPPRQFHASAMTCQTFGDRTSNPPPRAGDDADLAAEIELAHQFAPCRAMRCASDQRCTSDGPS